MGNIVFLSSRWVMSRQENLPRLANWEVSGKYGLDSFPHGVLDDAEHVKWGERGSNNRKITPKRAFLCFSLLKGNSWITARK